MAVGVRAPPGGVRCEYRPAGGRGPGRASVFCRVAVLVGSHEALAWCTRTGAWSSGGWTRPGPGAAARAGLGSAVGGVVPPRLHRRAPRARALLGARGGARAARTREIGDAEGDGRQARGAR